MGSRFQVLPPSSERISPPFVRPVQLPRAVTKMRRGCVSGKSALMQVMYRLPWSSAKELGQGVCSSVKAKPPKSPTMSSTSVLPAGRLYTFRCTVSSMPSLQSVKYPFSSVRRKDRNAPVPVVNQHSPSSKGFSFRSHSQWIRECPPLHSGRM